MEASKEPAKEPAKEAPMQTDHSQELAALSQKRAQLAIFQDMLLRERILLNAVNDIFRKHGADLRDKNRRHIRIADLERKIDELKKML